MPIHKYGDKYRVVIEAGVNPTSGSRVRLTRVAASKREAVRLEREMLEDVSRTGGAAGHITVERFANHFYLPSLSDLAPSTVSGYEAALRAHVVPHLGSVHLSSVTIGSVQKMLSDIPTRGGQDNAHKVLRQMFTMAQTWGMSNTNPAKAKFKKLPKTQPDQTLLESVDEMRVYAEAVRGCAAEAAVLLCLGAGLRKGEALGCDWTDVDFSAGEVTVRQSYIYVTGQPQLKAPKTSQSYRTVPVVGWALRRLREIRDEGGVVRMGPVCVGSDGSRLHPERAHDALRSALDKSPDAKRVPFLNLRHSFATFAISSGVEIATVSKWLGHSTIMTTYNRYVKVGARHLHKAVDILNAACN